MISAILLISEFGRRRRRRRGVAEKSFVQDFPAKISAGRTYRYRLDPYRSNPNIYLCALGLGEMIEGDFANTCAEKFGVEGLACADLVVRTSIAVSGNI
jgi:hypothetical protein